MIDPVEDTEAKIRQVHPTAHKFTWGAWDGDPSFRVDIELNYQDTTPMVAPVALQSSRFENETSVQDTQKFIVDKTSTNTFTWTLAEALKVRTKFKATVPFVGETEVSAEVDLESTQEQTTSHGREWKYEADIPVPANTTVEVTFAILEGKLDTPFSLAAKVRGPFAFYEDSPEYCEWCSSADYCMQTGWLGLGDPRIWETVVSGRFKGVDATKYVVKSREVGTDKEQILDYGRIHPLHGTLVSEMPGHRVQ